MTPEVVRVLLVIDIIAVALVAFFYLSRQHLTVWQFMAWALLALAVPLLGPFLVIVFHPRGARPPQIQLSKIERARKRRLSKIL